MYGTDSQKVSHCDGDIDIDPEKVYREGILCDGQKGA